MSHTLNSAHRPLAPNSRTALGGVQHDIFFSVMKIIHRQPENTVRPATASSDKVDRLSCCCRISELMPLVRQLHDEARARHEAGRLNEQRQQAA